jgi:hypothetical protein
MKNSPKRTQLLLLIIVSGLVFSFCKKDDSTNNTDTFPTPISNIISQSMIDSLTADGATIYAGTTPPTVNGIFLMHPDSCIYDNSPGQFAGALFDDYKFNMSNQNNSLFTISVAQKDVVSGILNSTPVSTYISGSGNNFSIFLLRTSSASGIAVRQFNVLSGTLTQSGIQNFQNTLYLRSKTGDPTNTIAPVGTIRVFVTGKTGVATVISSF